MRRLTAARRWDGTMAAATYVLGGSHETRITVMSQQVRAINLAVALARSGALEGEVIGVVGAGAGGATFAAAAALLGAEVHLYDEHEEPVSTQRWSFDRYLHPNLFDWPVEGWDRDTADLPVATWSAGPSAETRRELLTGFAYAARAGDVRWHPQHSVSEVRERVDGVWATICDLRTVAQQPPAKPAELSTKRFDHVVVATGFLPEAPIPEVDSSGSYWKDQNLPGTIGADHVTIVGDGDGALTELLLLTVCRASGAAAHEQLRVIAHQLSADRQQVNNILDVESELSASRSRGSLEKYGHAFGSSWTPKLDGVPRIEVRSGRVALRRTSFAINRFLAARLAWAEESPVRFVQGGHHDVADVKHMGPTRVIWRTGTRTRDRTLLVKPALTVRAAGDAMAREPEYQDVVGTVDQLMDYTRERLWGDVPELEHPSHGSAVEALAGIEDRDEPDGLFFGSVARLRRTPVGRGPPCSRRAAGRARRPPMASRRPRDNLHVSPGHRRPRSPASGRRPVARPGRGRSRPEPH